MELRFVHLVSAPLGAVEAALLDPGLIDALPSAIALLSSAELRVHVDRDGEVRRESFFVLRREAWPGSVRRILPPVAWTERVVWRRSEHEGSFVVVPEVPAPLVGRTRCGGRYALAAISASVTERRIEGELVIDAPFVGARAEAIVVGVLARWFEDEARLLAARAAGAV